MSERIEKFNNLLKQQLSLILLSDFPAEIINLNFINTKADLSESKIFFSVFSGHKSVYDIIIKRSNFYRSELSKKLYIRKVPKLIFLRDDMLGSVSRIKEIIEKF